MHRGRCRAGPDAKPRQTPAASISFRRCFL